MILSQECVNLPAQANSIRKLNTESLTNKGETKDATDQVSHLVENMIWHDHQHIRMSRDQRYHHHLHHQLRPRRSSCGVGEAITIMQACMVLTSCLHSTQ